MKENVMKSYLKDQWYQLEEQYRNEEYRKKKHHRTQMIIPFNKLQSKLEKKNVDKHINNKRRKSKKVGNIVFEFI
tara:strand:+ start:220 stop:444 length:225 start_codon:yes stop_codon:yes gene_type:complete